jgi:hypothetical protein
VSEWRYSIRTARPHGGNTTGEVLEYMGKRGWECIHIKHVETGEDLYFKRRHYPLLERIKRALEAWRDDPP